MALQNNPVLGAIQCPTCQGEATVHKTTRGKGRYLYTRCIECGPDQRTGRAVQKRIWEGAEFRPGLKPQNPPPNVYPADDWQPGQPNPAGPSPRAKRAEKKATEAPPSEKPSEPQGEPKAGQGNRKKRALTGLAGLALLGTTATAAWLKSRANTGGQGS